MASFNIGDPTTYRTARTNIPKNFSYTLQAQYTDTLRDLPVSIQYIQVTSNDLLSADAILNVGYSIMSFRDYAYAEAVAAGVLRLDLTIVDALINPNVVL